MSRDALCIECTTAQQLVYNVSLSLAATATATASLTICRRRVTIIHYAPSAAAYFIHSHLSHSLTH